MAAKRFYDTWGSRASNIITVWPVLVPSGIIAVISGYLARGVTQIAALGPFGWWSAGLLSFLIFALGLQAISKVWTRWVIATAAKRNSLPPDAINPLEPEFRRHRIKIHNMSHPITGRIKNKRFIDCELEGPANLILIGAGMFQGVRFLNCDFVIHRDGPCQIVNCVVVEDCDMLGGELHRCTLFMDQAFFDRAFSQVPGVNLITYARPDPQVGQ